ncbi:uncharacterized protein K02A2.6-like [Haliotis rufescens]|uniref:uncharacterized protein K02A2.6-like n=1 Tax=Haliotis rufescens TaxID=6454 RepID=UPI00201F0840|nr:uncharacterized protein K02A2.6-like [Haliotis rufescens]
MTKTQVNYAQIEKELLAIVFACEKFHDYILGKEVTVETDHQPLISIYKKAFFAAPARLQRMLLRLQQYDLKLVYKKGEELHVADTLSRAFLKDNSNIPDYEEFEVMTVLPMTDARSEQLKAETGRDPELVLIRQYVKHGWPQYKRDVHPEAWKYFSFRDEITECDNILFKGDKVIVPTSLRHDYMKHIHQGHLNAERCKGRARDFLYWCNMNSDIEQWVAECAVCNSCKSQQRKEPLKCHEIPTRPWQILASDLFTWNSTEYLVLVDSYSGWIEMNTLNTTTSAAVIRKLKGHFARFGVPDTLLTDNGPQFSSREFALFAKTWGFTHKTSSPGYPQSNGLAEKAVQSDPYLAILNQRNTPRDQVLGSPAQRLMSRRTKTETPMSSKLLSPVIRKPSSIYKRLVELRGQQKQYFDKTAKLLPRLEPGDKVRILTNNGFDRLGLVRQSPRSYIISSEGKDLRRNRRQLSFTHEKTPVKLTPPPEEYTLHTKDTETQVTKTNMRQEITTKRSEDTRPMVVQENNTQPNMTVTRSGRTVKPNHKYLD